MTIRTYTFIAVLFASAAFAACHEPDSTPVENAGAPADSATPAAPTDSAAPSAAPSDTAAPADSATAAPSATADQSAAASAAPPASAAPASDTSEPAKGEHGSKGSHATHATEAAAPSSDSSSGYSGADPCSTKSFHFAAVRMACGSGGRKAAKDLMRGAVKKAKAAGNDVQCNSCHLDMKSYQLKSNAVSDLKQWL
jgi:hypothetical protein